MKTKKTNEVGNFPTQITFTLEAPNQQSSEMNVVYGNPSNAPTTNRYYAEIGNLPDSENKLDIFLPFKGSIIFDERTELVSIDASKPVTCILFCDDTKIANNQNEGSIFNFFKWVNNRCIEYEFDKNWLTKFISTSLINCKDWFLELRFSLLFNTGSKNEPMEFSITSNPNATTYFTSTTADLFVPPINFFSETNELVVTEPELTEPIAADGLVNINLGKPAVIGNPEYTYDLNVPNENNEVLLMAPFGFSVYIDNAKYPHGKFIGFSGTPEVKMAVPGMPTQEYNRMDEISNFISITNSGKAFNFKLNPDWNRRINAQALNNAGECSLQFNFDIDIEVSEIEGAPRIETINVNSGTMQVDSIKFNCEVKAPKPEPEPIPMPETVLNNPVGTGSIIHIELGKPETTVTPEYAYDTIAPDCDNNINLMAPLEFTMTLDAIKYPNSVIKGVSGAPVINMNIPNIGIKEYRNNAATAITISDEGKKLHCKLDPDWNQKINATSLNESAKTGNAVIDFAVEIVIITAEKDGTKTTKKEKVTSDSLQLKPINFNSEVQAPKPQPEPIPVPVTVLNAPVGSGSVINIQLGKPTTTITPQYKYDTIAPDSNNNISLMAPLEFTMTLDKTKYPNSVIKGFSGTPVISMNIPNIGIKEYKNNAAKAVTITEEGKKLNFKLDPDWNQKVNATSLNDSVKTGNAAINFSIEIVIITTEKDGTATTKKEKVDAVLLKLKPIAYNAQVYVPKPIKEPITGIHSVNLAKNNPFMINYGYSDARNGWNNGWNELTSAIDKGNKPNYSTDPSTTNTRTNGLVDIKVPVSGIFSVKDGVTIKGEKPDGTATAKAKVKMDFMRYEDKTVVKKVKPLKSNMTVNVNITKGSEKNEYNFVMDENLDLTANYMDFDCAICNLDITLPVKFTDASGQTTDDTIHLFYSSDDKIGKFERADGVFNVYVSPLWFLICCDSCLTITRGRTTDGKNHNSNDFSIPANGGDHPYRVHAYWEAGFGTPAKKICEKSFNIKYDKSAAIDPFDKENAKNGDKVTFVTNNIHGHYIESLSLDRHDDTVIIQFTVYQDWN